MKQYSFKKGLGKGLISAMTVLAAIIALAGWNEVSLWELVEENLKPVLGSMTVGGTIGMFINAAKFHLISKYE